MTLDDDLNVFHAHWLKWWDDRGYARPALREDFERELRQGKMDKPDVCQHGESPLTCETCYFENFKDE